MKARINKLLKDEHDAVRSYGEGIAAARQQGDNEASETLQHIRGEEKEHAKELQNLKSPRMAKNSKLESAFREVYAKTPKTVKATGKTGGAKRKMLAAIAFSKARAAGAKLGPGGHGPESRHDHGGKLPNTHGSGPRW